MQAHKFRTSPALDKIDAGFYCIKGTQYPEDSRMVRVMKYLMDVWLLLKYLFWPQRTDKTRYDGC